MVKGRKHQNVSFEQWTVKDLKILIKYYGFKYFLKLLTFLFVAIQTCDLDRNVRNEAEILKL